MKILRTCQKDYTTNLPSYGGSSKLCAGGGQWVTQQVGGSVAVMLMRTVENKTTADGSNVVVRGVDYRLRASGSDVVVRVAGSG